MAKRKADAVPGGGGKGGYLRKTADGVYKPTDGKNYGDAKSFASQSSLNALMGTEEGFASGTSVFDPVLVELSYRWFCPPGGVIVDPFAGGSVRGIVASKLGFRYYGIDLSERQIAANRVQAETICKDSPTPPTWIVGSSTDVETLLPAGLRADMIFSCPPYADLEVYSDDPRDLSNMPYDKFVEMYREIITACCRVLKDDRHAIFIVGDVRDKDGFYYCFPEDTVWAFLAAGLRKYNESILVTAVGSLPVRVGKQFRAGRKLGKTHQNVLGFVKGDPKRVAALIKE